MVKAGGIFVCILIIGLDIAAGILGLEAEVEQNKCSWWSGEAPEAVDIRVQGAEPRGVQARFRRGSVPRLSPCPRQSARWLLQLHLLPGRPPKGLPQSPTHHGLPRLHLDHTGGRAIHVGRRDTVEPQVASLLRLHAPPLPLHRRHPLLRPRPLLRRLLRFRHRH
ncbi:uncharacterized protein LOC115682296 isoform X1 [Syzygium oleosum]|uniref:uncharacterized protein LOC115682296 isoform X1 n=1 Tax=Syzygium oleosum TaxID=219896 RepID=UPI0024BA1C9B|nr:uncharacterized protein LOC115682296 isoform X1 [Syzygium oleosum]